MYLSNHGCDPTAVDGVGDSALHWAAYKGKALPFEENLAGHSSLPHCNALDLISGYPREVIGLFV